MDDVNINKICLDIKEVELDGDEKEWIKLSWISNKGNDDFQSEILTDSDNEVEQIKDCDNKVTNTEPEDVSDGISVITESDVDVNTNLSQICQFKPIKSPEMPEMQISRQKDIWNILTACVLGIIIGLALSQLFTNPETCPVSGGVDAESLRAASHNIVNTCKELRDVKTMLNEIKTHIPADKKITNQFLMQLFKITDSSNETSSKSITITKEFFNSTSHPLDQLQGSLHVLSSLAFIYDENSSLENEINKTLAIVNNTKVFYDTLMLYTNNTQDKLSPIILNFLQHNSDKMHITSKLLLSNLVEKVSKVTLKIYNKYAKERHRLNKKLCHLKSVLLDDKFLKQLTENNQLFKDYDKSCFSNYISKNFDNRTIIERNTKIKEQIAKTDDTVLHPKYDKKNIDVIHDNNRGNSNFLQNERNKRQKIDKSTMKLLKNSHKIHNTSQSLLSEAIENISKLRCQLNKKLHHLKNMLPNDSELLKQLVNVDERDIKKTVKCCEGKDNLQSNTISKNNFDNNLMQLKNTYPLSINYCPKFDINMNTFNTDSNHKIKNYKHKKHTNSKKTADHENSAKVLRSEGENRPKKKDFKPNGTKKVINDKANYEGKNISSQNKIKNISEHTANYHKSKNSSFDSRTMKQDNHYTNADRRSDSKRCHEYKQQQLDDLNWYFRRVYSRRNARRHAEYIYKQDTKWKNHR